jgi:cation diffusion facilitator CzcD-associated flavoprotein CzcO
MAREIGPDGLVSTAHGASADVDVAIIGSGFAGVGMGYRLKDAGMHDFVILERAADVGGTWWWNTYPGCQCDIPSHLYSFSFALNPNWTRTYPLQKEILDYLRGCAEEFGLMPHIRFGCEVTRASWNPAARRWRIDTSRGEIRARVLVAAHGSLSEPRLPVIPGRESFAGRSFHSAQWDHSVDLAGKRVAVLGTGASAIQIVPGIQPEVERLHVFQRTPPWILPHTDRAITRIERWLYRRVPPVQRIPRALAYWYRELASPAFTRDSRLLTPLELHARLHMKRQVKDAGLREKLTPTYRIGCKRILPSNKWYPAIQAHNVEVVTDRIAEITPRGILTSSGEEFELDVIIYATGFEVTDVPLSRLLVGRRGQTLDEAWRGSPQAYKNATVPGFPNLFLVPGLQTGYSSQVFMIEAQLNYVIDALGTMHDQGLEAIDVKDDAFGTWNDAVQRRMPPTVWNSGGCASWYIDRNGLNTTVWPDFTWRFRGLTRKFDLAAYEVVGAENAGVPPLCDRKPNRAHGSYATASRSVK